MDQIYVILSAALASAIVAGVMIMLTKRGTTSASFGDADNRIHQLEAELATLRVAKGDVDRRLAAEEQKAARILPLEAALAEKTSTFDALR